MKLVLALIASLGITSAALAADVAKPVTPAPVTVVTAPADQGNTAKPEAKKKEKKPSKSKKSAKKATTKK